jgi:dihydrofolate reductase
MNTDRRVILYIAMSLDGYIAKPGDDLGFLSIVEKDGEDYGYNDFIRSVDTVVLGRRTYDWVMEQVPIFPHADLKTYVLTRTPRPASGLTEFYTGDLKKLIISLKQEIGKNIFIDGGADIVNQLLAENLIDDMIISIIPILTGHGIRLFKDGRPEQILKLVDVRKYDTGLVQVHYSRRS